MLSQKSNGSIKLSAVITIYNKKEYIKRSLASVLNQKKEVSEIILVDDGSSDNWEEEVSCLLENTRVRVLKQKNSGVSVARNNGARAANNEFVCFLDADDEWLPNFTEQLEKLIKDAPEATVFSLRHSRLDGGGEKIRQKVDLPSGYSGIVPNFIKVDKKGYGVIHSSAVCLRKSLFDKYEGFPPGARKSEDIFFWLQLGMNEKIAFRDAECTIRHSDGSGVRLRSTVVPYHIDYYVIRNNIASNYNPELLAFMRSNTTVLFMAEKMQGNGEVIKNIRKAAGNLGFIFSLKIKLLNLIPSFVLRVSRYIQLSRRKIINN